MTPTPNSPAMEALDYISENFSEDVPDDVYEKADACYDTIRKYIAKLEAERDKYKADALVKRALASDEVIADNCALRNELEAARKGRKQKADLLNLSLQLLGPKGSDVLKRLIDGDAMAFHASWGDEAHTLTGEERADVLLQFMEAPTETLTFNDSHAAPTGVKTGGEL